MPSKKPKKYKLLLDEGLPPKEAFRETNNFHSVRHINHDLKKGGASDSVVYQEAIKKDMLPVVLNIKDFKPLIKKNLPSVISLSTNLINKDVDLKLCKALSRLKPSEEKGCLVSITNQGIEIKRIVED